VLFDFVPPFDLLPKYLSAVRHDKGFQKKEKNAPAPQGRKIVPKKREDCMMSELLNRITTFYKRSVQ